MDGTGQGRPGGERDAWGVPLAAALEALGEQIGPGDIEAVLRRTGRQSRRVRRLPASEVVWLVIAMGLFGDGDVPSVWRRAVGALAALREAARGRRPPAKSAFSAARRRLGARPLRLLFTRTAGPVADERTPGAFYKGLRLMVIDAVSLDAPDTPANRAAFGGSSSRRNGKVVPGAYPRPSLCFLEEAGTRVICEALVRPFKCDEVGAARFLLRRVPPRSLVIWDRRYYARHLIHAAMERGTDFLGRLSSQARFTPVAELPDGSTLARIERRRREHPPAMVVRLIRYTVDDPHRPGHGQVHRLVSSLLDHERYPARELAELYHQRWEIEISNNEIKTHQLAATRPTGLRSLTPAGVVQEIYGLLVAYNGVRRLMHKAAEESGLDPRRLSFTHALRVVREATPALRAAPPRQRPQLLAALTRQIAQAVLPPRANRVNPRVVKRKMSHYLAKRPEHLRPPRPTRPFADAVVILK